MSGKQTGQGFQSFEQLMAQRYPQTNRSTNAPGPQQPQQPQGGQRQQVGSQQSLNHSQQGGTQQQGRASLVAQGSGSNGTQPAQSSSGGTNAASGTGSTSKTVGSGTSSSKKDSSKVNATILTFNTPQQKQQLQHCDWKDKVLWATRLILGGNSINGFLRATATAQRIKKQRARQTALTKKQAAAAAAAAAGTAPPEPEEKSKDAKKGFDQIEEEKLKKEIMNPRTAKKIKSEIEHGLLYCASVHNILRGILFDIDPSFAPHLPTAIMIEDDQSPGAPNAAALKQALGGSAPSAQAREANNVSSGKVISSSQHVSSKQPLQSQPSTSIQSQAAASTTAAAASSVRSAQSSKTTASPGDPGGSTLRKMRKKKMPPNTEPPVDLPEFDPSGRRVCSKKEHHARLFKALRFRALKQGDFVAARLTSRDLWILAMVQKDYAGYDIYPVAFVKLTEQKRDALFKEKVVVKDVEDKDKGETAMVPRSLALPLPRTFAEAAEWATRIKKGSRVYAMYPQTTSLYSATVIDSTTYCRGDDDIIVVEFDGEEPDATGQVPKYHIPARFVTLIPKEFPASTAPAATTNKRKGAPMANAPEPKKEKQDDFLSMGFDDGNFDALDLDFDKPLDALDEEDDFPNLAF